MKGIACAALFCTAGILGMINVVKGQVKEPDFDLILENITTLADEDMDLESLYETLESLYNRPLDLNTVKRADLQTIPFLSEEEITAILEFREEFGDFISYYELYMIEGLDSAMTDMIIPFVQVSVRKHSRDTIPFISNLIRTSRKSLMIRYARLIQTQKGYLDKDKVTEADEGQYFAGSADHVYGRFELHEIHDFDLGLTFEKDAGEAFFFSQTLKNYGFDHYAGYFRLLDRGLLRDLTIGDFQVHFGEGLVWGRGYGSKGIETIAGIRNRHCGSRPYQGASESGFLRGLSLTLGTRNFSSSVFASRKLEDAVLITDSLNQGGSGHKDYFIRSILSTGYHRTPYEIHAKNKLVEYVVGSDLHFLFLDHSLILGAVFYSNFWDYPIYSEENFYNQTGFKGNENHAGSIYYNFYKGKYNIFGEIARSLEHGYAMAQGIIANILPNFETAIHIRYFSLGYYARYGKSFSEYSGNNNEKGIYWGVKINPFPHFEIRAYCDIFRSGWPRYNIAAPFTGRELFINFRYQPRSSYYYSASVKMESKEKNDSQSRLPVYSVARGSKTNYQLMLSIQPTDNLKLQSRIQGGLYRYRSKQTLGYCLAQDLAWEIRKFRIHTRIAYFMTEDYNNRQFLYEHDLLYAYSIPAYNGQGIRAYILLKYSPSRNMDFWLKASQYHYFGIEEIGSGLSEIPGNNKTEIKCQVRIKF